MMDALLRDRYWHLLCHASELAKPGDFLKLRWLDKDVVVASDQGNLVVFDNVCPHRGAKLYAAEHGNGPITCRYHGWSYNAGELHIPCRPKFREDEVALLSLTTLKIDWCGDFLFASPDPAHTLDEQLGDLFDQLAAISMEVHGRHAWNAYTYDCDWKIAVENALDSLHTPFVHKDSLNRLRLSDPVNSYVGMNSVARFEICDAQMLKQLKSTSRLFAGSERFEGYMSIYLFPFTMLTSTFGYSYSLQHFFPSDVPQKANFYSRLLRGSLRQGLPSNALDHFFDSTAKVNETVFEEDNSICREMDFSRYDINDLGRLSVDEEKIEYFRRGLQTVAAKGAATTPQSLPASLRQP
ncbi:Rieske 2Fe-2S domain-containing protein [Roseateles asaccharophilus]|uniref:Phenylpropionate dioxygenase-like ring-hydroxylating dioxygenase large terminal subunit n=1 Tax=Roseateles asaccharophilus TaxID=582607 RepID=A0ABU2AFF4_9BURK|nr:Rieske 2Fe-2S domain-containing protein [Roseateles asaccharophilus]MDR7334698.1 phenylpropionate dioxygenase-like ring-hydroxylating dioxygenase large terminal subunit [Roseateles asaccharophilus]